MPDFQREAWLVASRDALLTCVLLLSRLRRSIWRPQVSLHPRLQAALERDGVSLSKLAETVGLDGRTVAKWGSDDECGSLSCRFRRLEDVISGRARIVERDGALRVEELGGDVSRAEVIALAKALSEHVDALRAALDAALRGKPFVLREPTGNPDKTTDPDLRRSYEPVYRPAMNAPALQSVAAQARARSRGRMVPYIQKVPPDMKDRLRRAAAKVGLSEADYVRALFELYTEDESLV